MAAVVWGYRFLRPSDNCTVQHRQGWAKILTLILETDWAPTLGELLASLPHLQTRQRRSTWAILIREFGADTPITALTAPVLARWAMCSRSRWAPGTINRRLHALGGALRQAADLGLLAEVPRVVSLREPPARDRICSPRELSQVLQQMRGPAALAVHLAYHTGMRRGEICALAWGQIDLPARMARLYGAQTKPGKPRSVPITTRLHLVLLAWGPGAPAQRVVGLQPGTITQAWIRACRRAGVAGLRLHDLRHTHLTRLRRAGVDVFTLSAIAGHSSVATAARYQTILESDLAAAAQRLD